MVDGTSEAATSEPVADETIVEQLQAMGFSRHACVRACIATGSNLEGASNWLMEHLDDVDLNDPIPCAKPLHQASASVSVDMGALATLLEMGISEDLVN